MKTVQHNLTPTNGFDPTQIIECLCHKSSISDCWATLRRTPTGTQRLVVYFVPTNPFSETQLKSDLRHQFPDLPPIDLIPISVLPLDDAGQIDEDALAHLPVLDQEIVARLEASLEAPPDREQFRVHIREHSSPPSNWHLSDILPGWTAFDQTLTPEVPVDSGVGKNEQAHQAPALPNAAALAISHGPALKPGSEMLHNLPEALQQTVRQVPQHGLTYIQADGSVLKQSYAALLAEAQCILGGLRSLGLQPQDKVLFQFDLSQDFIPAFWGCMLGGFVPVPVSIAPSYAGRNSTINKLENAWRMLDRPLILSGQRLLPRVQGLSTLLGLDDFRVESLDTLRAHAPDEEEYLSQPDDLALLLLTSGSTGLPKAVTQTHGSLISRSLATAQMNDFTADDVSLNLMPLDHVGGIVMFSIRDVCTGAHQVHAETASFLQEPLKWLDWIETYGATITWAPNFAYRLVNDQAETLAQKQWDLSTMRFILNAGEAIVAHTTRQFLKLLQPHGLPAIAMRPAWGMSETSSAVTFLNSFTLAESADDDVFVSVGAPIPGFSMRIVDQEDQLVPEEIIGRLQVKGLSVTKGYYQNPTLNQESFTADGWFKTGDLGFIKNGCLTITGREKGLIIINGINYHSHEIEKVVEEINGISVSFTAATAVRNAQTDSDQLAIFFHTPLESEIELATLLKSVREAVVRQIGINPTYLIPLEKDEIPKTAIGKIQRTKLSHSFEAGEFDEVRKRLDLLLHNKETTIPDWFFTTVWRRKEVELLAPTANESSVSLIFADQSGLGAALSRQLTASGHPCVTVEAGSTFAQFDQHHYQLDPHHPADYRRLLTTLAEADLLPQQIFHLWPYDLPAEPVEELATLQEAQYLGLYSLLFLTQALAPVQNQTEQTRLFVATRNLQAVLADDELQVVHGALPGLLKTLPQELPWLNCRHIDLGSAEITGHVKALVRESRMISADREVAYRHGERWIARLKAVDFSERPSRTLPFKEGGIYLLTGGLGGLGMEVAHYLLKNHSARLLIVGRAPLAERRDRLQSLHGLGGQVRYEALDLADIDRLRQAVDRVRAEWSGELAGIIHLAGTYHETPVLEEDVAGFTGVLQPKVFGTWALHQLLKAQPDALFLTFSSVNAFFGGFAVSAYAAANSFLDTFIQYRQRHESSHSVSLAWSLWDEIGMSRGFAMKDLTRKRGYHLIPKRQGLKAMVAALYRPHPHMLIGLDGQNRHIRPMVEAPASPIHRLTIEVTGPATQLPPTMAVTDHFGVACKPVMSLVQHPEQRSDHEQEAHQTLATAGEAPSETEQTLLHIWEEVLNLDHLSLHDNFFDLGGNSLLMAQINHRVRSTLDREVSMTDMFQYATISALAKHLAGQVDERYAAQVEQSQSRGQKRRAMISRQKRTSKAKN